LFVDNFMITLQGTIVGITFRNEDSGFTIIRFKPEGKTSPCVCVGVITTVAPGQTLRITGDWEEHKRFGPQFSIKNYEIIRPATIEGIEAMLGSGLISNIGAVRAHEIIKKFGLQTIDILDNSPERLIEVPGIGKKNCEKIRETWQQQSHIRDIMLFLQECAISVNLAHKIYKAYGKNAREYISRDPYCLIDDIWGIGFTKADAVAQKLGFVHDSFKRIRAGLLHTMYEANAEGHTYLPKGDLTSTASELLEVKEEQVVFTLDHCIKEMIFTDDEGKIFLPHFLEAEKTVAEILSARAAPGNKVNIKYETGKIDAWMDSYCKKTGWTADPKQLEAVKILCSNSILLLTGGPGTGKTTTLQIIVSFFGEHKINIALAAPTGRAAQRMGSIAGIKASTIHRLLEFRPGKGKFNFARNTENPIDADMVIIDEISMVDIMLMRSLVCAIRPNAVILMVGDRNQLPSVGPGNVLADMIGSKRIPHLELTTIFRQASQSRIVTVAHEIINGVIPQFSNEKNGNCFFIREENPEHCLATVIELVKTRLPNSYGFNPVTDIQILSPMHRGTLGTQNINRNIQAAINSGGKRIMRGEIEFCICDRVMQIRNNYDLGVFNGDIGYIYDCTDNGEVIVDFDGQRIMYDRKNLDELVHAYCISIHKSQGCEFRAVIVIMMTQHFVLLQRNLLYTAITRARELCILIGMPKAFAIAVNNNEAFHRYSNLSMRIAKSCKNE